MDSLANAYQPMNAPAKQPRPRPPSVCRIGFTLLLMALSAMLIANYPHTAWLLGASLGAVATITLFLRVGWVIPCMIAGTYSGFVLDARVKGGTIESQMWETVVSIAVGATVGLVAGLAIDSLGGGAKEDG